MATSAYNFRAKNTIFEGSRGHPVLDTVWFPGTGAQSVMIERANRMEHDVWFEIQEPGATVKEPKLWADPKGKQSGFRGFCSYPDWKTAFPMLNQLEPPRRHVFEILKGPVKPYLDLDGDDTPADVTPEIVMERAEKLLTRIFRQDYDVYLQSSDFNWTVSKVSQKHDAAAALGVAPKKISLHLVISTHRPQVLFASSSSKHPDSSAYVIAKRLRQTGDEVVAPLVDLTVYDHNRKMRTVGSSKPQKHYSVLEPVDLEHYRRAPKDFYITWHDDEEDVRTLTVPLEQRSTEEVAMPKQPRKLYPKEVKIDDQAVQKVLEMLCKVHKSAYYEPRRTEDFCDPLIGLHFNYKDRAERCWTGNQHDQQGVVCYVGEHGAVWARCWSDHCKQQKYLGDLSSEYIVDDNDTEEPYESGAIHVNLKYLSKGIDRPDLPSSSRTDDSESCFQKIVDDHLAGKFQVLNISSGLGTGKTTMLHDHITKHFEGCSILFVVYRISLGLKLSSDLLDLAFINYKSVELVDVPNLDDREAYPRVVCQLDSIWRLEGDTSVPLFDLVVCDEIEMLLNHVSASTLRNPVRTFDTLIEMISIAKRGAILLDGLWGARTYNALSLSGISQRLVINDFRPVQKTFVFMKNEEVWLSHIADKLCDDKNLVIVCLSASQAKKIEVALVEGGIVDESEILVHTSKEGDEERKQLENVEQLWITKRVVIYSPTVESGTSFDIPHFHSQFIYCCGGSTTAQGLFQMTGRIRVFEDNVVECCADRNIKLPSSGKKRAASGPLLSDFATTPEAEMQRIQWSRDCVDMHLPTVKVKRKGHTYFVPPSNALLAVLAHNAAQSENSKYNFYREFKMVAEKVRLVMSFGGAVLSIACLFTACLQVLPIIMVWNVQAGHIVKEHEDADMLIARKAEATKDQETERRQNLREGRDLSEDEYDELRFKVIRGKEATAEDKWAVERHEFKKSYNVDRLDDDFLEEVTYKPAGQVLAVQRNLALGSFKGQMKHDSAVIYAEHARGLFGVLGFAHPFDSSRIISEQELLGLVSDLKKTRFFADYAKSIVLYSRQAKTWMDWSGAVPIVRAINRVFKTAGLALEATEVSKKKGKRVYQYNLNAHVAAKQAELLKLKIREHLDQVVDEALAEYLRDLPFHYKHLICDKDDELLIV